MKDCIPFVPFLSIGHDWENRSDPYHDGCDTHDYLVVCRKCGASEIRGGA